MIVLDASLAVSCRFLPEVFQLSRETKL